MAHISRSNEEYCPICTTELLTAATKVYPLCDCKVSICFDCLRKWAKLKYCCPFCNIPFSQNTIRQTAEEIRLRLRDFVPSDLLDEVVEAWVNQLRVMRPDMEVGLAMLNMDADNYSLAIRRARTPVWSLNPYPYSSSSSHLLNLLPPMLTNNLSVGTTVVPPALSQTSNSVMGLPHSEIELPTAGKVRSSPSVRTNRSHRNRTFNDLGLNSSAHSLNDPNWRTKNLLRCPDLHSYGSNETTHLSINEYYAGDIRTPTMSEDEKSLDGRSVDHQREHLLNPSISSSSTIQFHDFVQKRGGRIKSILAKRLHVRELVKIRPGTKLARKVEPNSVGVVMKYTGGLPVWSDGDLLLEKDHPIFLTVRLLDGSWLTNVQADDVEAKGERATLRQYLRVGDLLRTRFGIAMTCELHPESRQVTVRYPNGWSKEDYSMETIKEICREVRMELHLFTVQSRCNRSDILENENSLTMGFKNEECSQEQKAITTSPKVLHRKSVLGREMKVNLTEMSKTERASVLESDLKERPSKQNFLAISQKNNQNGINEDLRFTERPSRPVSDSELNDLPEGLEDPDAFDKSGFVLIPNSSFSFNSSIDTNPSFRTSYNVLPSTDVPKNGTRPSCVLTDMHETKSVSSIEFKTKTIYEGDIKSVFSVQDIFEVIEKKVAEEVSASHGEMLRDTRGGASSRGMASLQLPNKLGPLEECYSRDVSNEDRDLILDFSNREGLIYC